MTVGLVVLAASVSSASAHLTRPLRGDHRDLTTARRSLAHSLYVCVRGSGRPQHRHCRAVPWLRQLVQRLSPHPVSHLGLWSCIHSQEGNDGAGTYTGPLQMTYPWEGLYHSWYSLPMKTVFALAEQKYREHGYSQAWLFGQWPNTAPNCV
jgi:hypothetical protein